MTEIASMLYDDWSQQIAGLTDALGLGNLDKLLGTDAGENPAAGFAGGMLAQQKELFDSLFEMTIASVGSGPSKTRCRSSMSAYSIGKTSADDFHSESVNIIGGGFPPSPHARSTAPTAASRSSGTLSRMTRIL